MNTNDVHGVFGSFCPDGFLRRKPVQFNPQFSAEPVVLTPEEINQYQGYMMQIQKAQEEQSWNDFKKYEKEIQDKRDAVLQSVKHREEFVAMRHCFNYFTSHNPLWKTNDLSYEESEDVTKCLIKMHKVIKIIGNRVIKENPEFNFRRNDN
jgi:hypothetical protein